MTDAWTRFWFRAESTHLLALLRIFVGFTFLQKLTGFHGFTSRFSGYIQLPRHAVRKRSSYHLDGFALDVAGFGWLPKPSFEVYQGIETAVLVLCLFFIVGLFTRVVAPIMALTWTYLFLLSQFHYHHHVFTFVLTLLVLGFSRCAEHYSLDALLFGKGKRPKKRPITPIRMLQVLVTFIYLFGTLAKIKGGWMNGEFVQHMYETGRMDGDLAFVVPVIGFATLGAFTVLVETLLIFGLWIPKLRRISWFLGIGLHLGIDLTMDVTTFGFQMLALYVAFVDPVVGRQVVLYDGTCNLCRRSRRLANAFDWFRRFTWLDFRDPQVMQRLTCVTSDELESEMVVIDDHGRLHRGFDGWCAMLNHVPLGFLVVGPLYLPPIRALGQRFYRWVASNRYAPLHCGDEGCRIEVRPALPPDGAWLDTVNLANQRARTADTAH